jgi:uncharacterized protein (DUF305 family)
VSRCLPVAIAPLLVALALVGCGGSEPKRAPAATSNLSDRGFINQAPSHHAETMAIARLGERRGQHPRVRALAREIARDHAQEVARMRRLSRVVRVGTGITMIGPSMTALSQEERSELRTAPRFDRLFIDLVVPHLTSTVETARLELAQGANPDLRSLARKIVTNEQPQIAELQRLRTRLYGGPVPEEYFDPERGEEEEEEEE